MPTHTDGLQARIRGLETKTGKSFEKWITTARASGRERHAELVAFLKSEYGITHGYANMIALETLSPTAAAGRDPGAALFTGARAGLRPVYDAVLGAVRKFGDDVELAPKRAYVSLRRHKQFAIVQPSTAERVDLGLNLKDTPPTGRLERSGSFNAMVTHRVRLATPRDVNRELIGWLKRAYDAS